MAAALILADAETARALGKAVQFRAAAHVNDFLPLSRRDPTRFEGGAAAWRQALADAGLTMDDLSFVETHDCFTIAELIEYEAMGLAEHGEGARVVMDGVTAADGKLPVNRSGGLKAKGHPVGATGVSMHVVTAMQLMGEAGAMQLPRADIGGVFNMGGGGGRQLRLHPGAAAVSHAPRGGVAPCTKRVMNLAHFLRQAGRRHADEIGFVWGEATWSWAELDERVDAMVAALAARGVVKGDRILVQSKNCNQMFESMFVCFRLGAVWVPANFRQTPSEVAYLAAASGASAMICQSDFPDYVRAAQEAAPDIGLVISIGAAAFGEEYDALVEAHRGSPVETADVVHDDPCWFFFTSGTTGRPKAGVLTHGQMGFVATNHLCDLMPGTTAADASLVVAPLSHGAGIHQLAQVARAVKTVLPAGEKFDVDATWALVERWRITNMFTVPTIVKMLTEHPSVDAQTIARLRYIIYAGAPMYREDQKHALKTLGLVLVQYFGLGEVTGNITVLPPALHDPEDTPGARIGTCGYERTAMQVSIPGMTRGVNCARVRRARSASAAWRCSPATTTTRRPTRKPSAMAGSARAISGIWTARVSCSSPGGRRTCISPAAPTSIRGDGGEAAHPPGDCRDRHRRRAGPDLGRGGDRGRGTAPRGHAGRGGAARLAGGQGRPLQAAEAGVLLGRAAEIRLRQDHEEDRQGGARSARLP